MMLVFVDESGDAGLKLEKGFSPFLVMTMVLFEDPQDAIKADNRVSELWKEMGRRSTFEFHFSESNRNTRILAKHFYRLWRLPIFSMLHL